MIEKDLPESHLQLTFRKDMGILFLRWSKQVGSALLRQGYLQALDFAEEVKANLWLFDLRGRGGATPEDETWILEEFYGNVVERLQRTGYFAYLVSPTHYAHLRETVGFEKLANFSEVVKIHLFVSELEAIEWLRLHKNISSAQEDS
ncbi:hypothetical protein TH61_07235 [Rufibacter sp. DG15C]|uniref:hypothetical protein n=1 Tax=Rufibacter sp. DG15C TaxID=1379909 RepID=UPI00078C94DD|nr:hypothetical protein [Rufibacter sp. DG15C]AMM51020.1 hypothetical protein TH61_07235 [Rufibacter sp. DG15C]